MLKPDWNNKTTKRNHLEHDTLPLDKAEFISLIEGTDTKGY